MEPNLGIYLDHAATSFPKPPEVAAAVQRWFAELGVSADRGDGDACALVAAEVSRVRRLLADDCGVPLERVAFCSGATEAIHLFFAGFLRPGDRVVTTDLEHSAIVRPLVELAETMPLDLVRIAPVDGDRIEPEHVRAALDGGDTRLFAFTSASNVTGAGTPTAELAAIARERGCVTLLDASQTAGLLPLDVGADAVVASAHKSLLGPPGLGFLAVRQGVDVVATKRGGTGSAIALDRQPTDWPTAFEPGTPNTPAIFGLGAALDWIATRGRTSILDHGLAVCARIRETLPDHVRVVGTDTPTVPIVSFVSDRFDPLEIGMLLSESGVHVRTGFHCAPWIHTHLGTEASGTVRMSPGPFVSEDEALRAVAALTR